MSIVSLTSDDGISPDLLRRIKRAKNMKPAMQEVELLVMKPLKASAWSASGLKSQSGELEKSVVTFSGKKSAGVSVHTSPGHDLVIPKAVTHTEGKKRHEHRKKQRIAIKSYSREGRKVRTHSRRNVGSPWGDIKARKFIPTKLSATQISRITAILERYLDV